MGTLTGIVIGASTVAFLCWLYWSKVYRPRGLGDLLLPYAMIEDGILLQNDGSLLAGWQFNGPDLESSEDHELNALSLRLNQALKLGDRWCIHCDLIRTEVQEYRKTESFPDIVTQAIEDERATQFRSPEVQYRSECFISLTYLPPLKSQQRVLALLTGASTKEEDIAAQHLATFKRQIASFENITLSLLNARRLKGVVVRDEYGVAHIEDELLRYLHRCITGKNHPIRLPECPIMLHDLLASETFVDGPRIGPRHIATLVIDGFPKTSEPGILAAFGQLGFEYRWSTRAITMDAQTGKGIIEKHRTKWVGRIRGFKAQLFRSVPKPTDPINEHAVKMVAQTGIATEELEDGSVQSCYYTNVLVLMDEYPERLRRSVMDARRTIENLGFTCREEDIGALEAWRGSIPGDGYRNVRRPELNTLNLADMLPSTSVWTGLETNPSPLMPPNSPPLLVGITTGQTAFNLNLHVRDLGHTIVAGPAGSGKSTLLGLMAAQWTRYPDAQVFCFDYDYSAQLLTHAVGGRFYDLFGNRELAFSPLQCLDEQSDRAWAATYIEDLCTLSGLPVNPAERNAIEEAIRMMAGPTNHRTISDFVATIQNESVREALKHYTLAGAAGSLLDAEHDTLSLDSSTRFVSFETKRLLESRDIRTALPALLYIFRRIEQRLDGSPTLIILDEAWAYLAHEVFQRHIEQWLRTVRRRNGVVVMASQQLSDFADSPIAGTIFDQTATTILLPNSNAPRNAKVYRERMGLNEREIYMLQTAIPKKHYYVVNSFGRRMVDMWMCQLTMSFVGVNAPKERERAARLMERYPATWRSEWLRMRHVGNGWIEHMVALETLTVEEERLCASA